VILGSDSGPPTSLDRQEWPHVFNISSDSESDVDINIVSLVGMDISNGFVKDDPIKNLEPSEGVRVLTYMYVPQNPGISEGADRFCGDNMFSGFVQLSNLYNSQNINKFKTSPKSLKLDIIMDKMKGCVPITILMRHVKG
jgi:hypothetical protein